MGEYFCDYIPGEVPAVGQRNGKVMVQAVQRKELHRQSNSFTNSVHCAAISTLCTVFVGKKYRNCRKILGPPGTLRLDAFSPHFAEANGYRFAAIGTTNANKHMKVHIGGFQLEPLATPHSGEKDQ